jgi:hypothetical protein
MTSPEPAPSPGSSADPGVTGGSPAPATAGATPAPALPGSLPEETVEALQLALTTEHAAIWAYGLIAAFDKDNLGSITAMRDAHLVRRNDTSARLTAGGATPVVGAAAYKVPVAVKDAATARQLALAVESDNAAAWLGVVGATDDAALRSYALAGLTDAAVRATTWKIISKAKPTTTTFPGRPTDG